MKEAQSGATNPEQRGLPETENPQKLDVLVVLGRNFIPGYGEKQIAEQRFHLSPDSRLNVLAAGILYKKGLAAKIIFSSGHTAGSNVPSEAQAMKTQLLRIFKDIPEDAIVLEETSLDTNSNAEEVKKIVDKLGLTNIGLLTVGAHSDRSAGLFEKAGMSVKPFISEEELRGKRPEFVKKYLSSELEERIAKQEKLASFVQSKPLGSKLMKLKVKMSRNPDKVNPWMKSKSAPEISKALEVLKKPHTYGVVMPYAQNLKDLGTRVGENRLTFYSAFNLNASYELYKAGYVKKLILCGETTFGDQRSTTSDLMRESLIRKGVPLTDIIVLSQPHLDNTALQIKAIAEYQKQNKLQGEEFLLVDWKFHDARIKNHIGGFGLNATTVQSEDIHKLLRPDFDLEKLNEVLPLDFEKREKSLRKLSGIDKRGIIPRLIGILRGASVTDIKKERDSQGNLHVGLENSTGKKKLEEKAA